MEEKSNQTWGKKGILSTKSNGMGIKKDWYLFN